MLHIDFDFGDPDDRRTVRALIDAYENRNADSKAADTSKLEPIIAQTEEGTQEELFDSPMLAIWEPDVNDLLKKYGLEFSDCYSPSAYKIACKKLILDNVDSLGLSALDMTLDTLMEAYPIGGEKWNEKIIYDVWSFYSQCMKHGIQVKKDQVVKYLYTSPRTTRPFTTDDFIKTLTLLPGEATLRRYNRGFKNKNKLPRSVLTGGFESLCH